MARQCTLTTKDNPYNPFDEFIPWMLFDVEKGYNTCEYLGRIAKTSEQLSEVENNLEIERAIDEIIAMHNGEIYKKVVREIPDPEEPIE